MAYAKSANEGKSKCEIFQDTVRDFGLFLYNKEKGEVMGRNGKSWAKITVFFLVFYACLAAFFAAMLAAFMSTVPAHEDGPKLTQYLAGKQGLNNVPKKIKGDFKSSHGKYVEEISSFLEAYKKQITTDKDKYDEKFCNDLEVDAEVGKKQCRFNLTSLGPCYSDDKDFDFGYKAGNPCIFIRMNKVFKWIPEPSENDWGVELKCYKEADKSGDGVEIYPTKTPGFPTNFYPYKIQDYWLAPVAAIKLIGAKKDDVILCEANAKNIEKSETFRIERGAHGRSRIEIGED